MAFSLREKQLKAIDLPTGDADPADQRYCPALAEIGRKIWLAAWSWWSLAVFGLMAVGLLLAYQGRPGMEIKLGGGFDSPYLNLSEGGFGSPVQAGTQLAQSASVVAENDGPAPVINTNTVKAAEELAQNYRWTRERPILLWPGIGSGASRLTLQATGSPLIAVGQSVEVLLNGQSYSRFELKPGILTTKTFDFGAAQIAGGSLTVEMRVKALGPVNQKLIAAFPGSYPKIDKDLYQGQTGFKLYNARLDPLPDATGLIIPPLGLSLSLIISGWLLYFGLAYAGMKPVIAFGTSAGFTLLTVLLLSLARLSLTIFTGRLALLMVLTVVMLPVLDWFIPRLFRRWQIGLPVWLWRGLLIMFVIGMLGRGGGVLYPQIEIKDAPAHLKEINTVLHLPDGISQELHSKELSKVPSQWESSAIIPYSPFVYFYLTPVAALPIDPNITVPLFNAWLDALRIFVIFALAVGLGAGLQGGLIAAGLYLIVPSTWMLHSWGNWPTTVSLWLATLYILLVLMEWQKLNRPVIWLSTTLVLLLTMLGYTVTAVFMGVLLVGWSLGLVFFIKRDPLARRNGLLIGGATLTATLLAVLIYYVQFIPDLSNTLTSFGSSLSSKGSLGGFGDRSLFTYLGIYIDHLTFHYGTLVVIVPALAVWLCSLVNRKKASDEDRRAEPGELAPNPVELQSGRTLWLAGVWFGIFVVFSLAQWKIDMVDKQVWFVLPLAVSLAGVAAFWAWQQFKLPALPITGRMVVAGLVLWTGYSAASLWFERIFITRR